MRTVSTATGSCDSDTMLGGARKGVPPGWKKNTPSAAGIRLLSRWPCPPRPDPPEPENAVGVSGSLRRAVRVERGALAHKPDTRAGGPPQEAALHASVRAGLGAVVLGLVLAPGLRLCALYPRPADLRVCLRHAARLVAPRNLHPRFRTVSRRLQHQSVPVVQAG